VLPTQRPPPKQQATLTFSPKDDDLQNTRRSGGPARRKRGSKSKIKANDAAGDTSENAVDVNANTTTSPPVEKHGSDANSGSDSPGSDNRATSKSLKREKGSVEDESIESDDQPVTKRRKRS